MKTLHAALLQQKNTESREANLDKSISGIIKAAQQGVQLILLPELHATLYPAQNKDPKIFNWAETIPGPSTVLFSKLSKEHNIIIVCSLFEKAANNLFYNTAVVLENGEIKGRYRKMHIPDGPYYHEKFYFTQSEDGFNPIQTSIGKLGILICWDQWFPEAARLMTLAGADLLLYPTAIGWDDTDMETEKAQQLDAWITIQRAHAITNIRPVLACNRVGFEPHPTDSTKGINFWGSSFIAGPQGEILACASTENSELISAKLDLGHADTINKVWPYRRDRRVDAYGDLTKR